MSLALIYDVVFCPLTVGTAPKQSGEGETDWLERALAAAQARGLNLSAFTKPGSMDPVEDFLAAHYSAVRCAAFHSKSSSGDALRPGSLRDYGVVLQQLFAVAVF